MSAGVRAGIRQAGSPHIWPSLLPQPCWWERSPVHRSQGDSDPDTGASDLPSAAAILEGQRKPFRPACRVTPTQDHSWERVDVTLCLLCHLARCTRSCCDGRKVSTWTDSRSPGCRLWLHPSVSRLLTLPGVARKEPRPPLEKLPGPPAPCAWPQLILYAPSRGLFKSNKSGGDFYLPSQVVLVVKNLPAHAGMSRDMGSIPGSGRSPGEGNGNPFQ